MRKVSRKLYFLTGSLLLVFSILLSEKTAYSQSPLTNIVFYKVYNDFGVVSYAEQKGYLDEKIAESLLSPKLATDVKAAIINALSFEILGKDNSVRFIRFLKEKYKLENIEYHLDTLTADELFCLGYLTVMDDYFVPEAAFPYFDKALQKNPKSFTIHTIYALSMAQQLFLFDKCRAWKTVNNELTNPELTDLMLPEAIDLIRTFINVYSEDCP